jgi:hypothetical protein
MALSFKWTIFTAAIMGCLPLATSAAPPTMGIPVILQGTTGESACGFPTPTTFLEIRDVSAQITVAGTPLTDLEVLASWAGGTALPTGSSDPQPDVSGAPQGQQIWLPITQTSQGANTTLTYNLHATVLMFAAPGSIVRLGFTSGQGGQTISFTQCQMAGFEGFPF